MQNLTNPFPGIRSFEPEDDYLFFGRERHIEYAVNLLFQTHFLAVLGSSGCGKSSLIRAGLIPSLVKNKFASEEYNLWKYVMFRPGDNPIGNLNKAIADISGTPETTENETVLRDEKNGLINVIEKGNLKADAVLIVIDQFEEIFRYSRQIADNKEETSLFVKIITDAISKQGGNVFIIITMRSDFLGDCTEFIGLAEIINKGHFLVPRMTKEEREDAILKPIKICGGSINQTLVKRLIDEVGEEPDQLPILQHALMRTWDYWMQNRLNNEEIDHHHYEAIGTVTEALSLHAESIFNEFDNDKYRIITEKIFKALTDISSENRGIRRPTHFGEILTITMSNEDDVLYVIDRFRQKDCAFLMPSFGNEIFEDSTIDISHESIMRIWHRLKEWIDEEIKSAELYIRLCKASKLYEEGKTGILVNPELEIALKWKTQFHPNLNWALRYNPSFERAINYLEYSKTQNELSILRKEEKQKRELNRTKFFAIILGLASIVSLVFLVVSLNMKTKAEASEKTAIEKEKIAIVASKSAEEQRKEALIQKKISEQQQQIADEQRILTEEQKHFALTQKDIADEQRIVAIEQKKKADISRNEAVLSRNEAEEKKKEAIISKNFAEEKRKEAEISEANTKRLRMLALSRTLAVQSIKMSNMANNELPKLLAVQAYKFNIDNGGNSMDNDIYNAMLCYQDKNTYRFYKDAVRGISVNNKGNKFITCGDDGLVIMSDAIDPANKSLIKTGIYGASGFRCISVSDGAKIVAGSFTGEVVLLSSDGAPTLIGKHNKTVNKVKFLSEDKIVSCGSDGQILIWTLGSEQPAILDQINTRILSLDVSKDNNKIVVGMEDGSMKIYTLNNSKSIVLSSKGKPIYSVAFSNDGKYIASGNSSGQIKIYDVENQKLKTELIGHLSNVNDIIFKRDDKRLITCSSDKTIRIWDLENTENNPVVIDKHDSWIYGVGLVSNDSKIVSVSADKTIRLWDLSINNMAKHICSIIKREDITKEEWEKYIGKDVNKESACLKIK
ncbi:MAG: hypothetical protein A2X12_04840 [Bacteroidetes bacterium GWE2_29_8]|nr:MAG: hypothetical protein A2X12_04840 [Bacteroidetes bacterium GWE2_29_8]OFY24599.1 MAG: hypothetical protein A2X02_03295 [Bacteroidetes bacterium GWF2_29_10]